MTKLKTTYLGNLRTKCVHESSGAVVETDAPKDNQGKGESFSATDLFSVSLGACILTSMGIAAEKAGIDLKGATVDVEKEMTSVPTRRIHRLIVRFRANVAPNPEERKKLEHVALNCPVRVNLNPEIKLEIDFVWGL